MKKYLLLLFGLSIYFGVKANDFSGMLFKTTDGKEYFVNCVGLEITLDGENLKITNSSKESLSLPVANVASMQFSNDPATVDGIVFDGESEVAIYSLNGYFIGNFNSIGDARQVLPQATYLVKDKKGRTVKMILKK